MAVNTFNLIPKNDQTYFLENTTVSFRHNLLYVTNPKAYCTSIKWWFAGLDQYAINVLKYGKSADVSSDLLIHESSKVIAHRENNFSAEQYDSILADLNIFKFSMVKNPFTRIFSAWSSKILLGDYMYQDFHSKIIDYKIKIRSFRDVATEFEKFLEFLYNYDAPAFTDGHFRPQYNILWPQFYPYDYIAKVENYEPIKDLLSSKIPQFSLANFLPHTNRSLLPYSSDFYTERSANIVRELYTHDFDYFNYGYDLPVKKIDPAQYPDSFFESLNSIRDRQSVYSKSLNSKNHEIIFHKENIAERDIRLSECDTELKKLFNTCQVNEKLIEKLYSELADFKLIIESEKKNFTEFSNALNNNYKRIKLYKQILNNYRKIPIIRYIRKIQRILARLKLSGK